MQASVSACERGMRIAPASPYRPGANGSRSVRTRPPTRCCASRIGRVVAGAQQLGRGDEPGHAGADDDHAMPLAVAWAAARRGSWRGRDRRRSGSRDGGKGRYRIRWNHSTDSAAARIVTTAAAAAKIAVISIAFFSNEKRAESPS